MKIVMIIFGIFFLLQGLVVLKNKRYGPEEGNPGLRGVVKGKQAFVLGGIFTLVGLVLILLGLSQ